VCAREAYSVISRELAAFQALYPHARVELQPGTSRDAISALFAANCDLAVITRELKPEERRAAVEGRLELEGYRVARSAVLIIVNETNPVDNLALQDVRRIYKGDVSRWTGVGGKDAPVLPVLQTLQSDITEYFAEEVLGDDPIRARAAIEATDSAVVARVKREPNAIGYVSLGTDVQRVKTARLSSVIGLPYRKPDLEAIHKGDYPLTRFINLYIRSTGPRLAGGFITFVTSYEGQKLVHQSGLVPTSVPIRFVRRSPMLSSHSRGDTTSPP
jgi:phosphate transport system substrate-binding protein